MHCEHHSKSINENIETMRLLRYIHCHVGVPLASLLVQDARLVGVRRCCIIEGHPVLFFFANIIVEKTEIFAAQGIGRVVTGVRRTSDVMNDADGSVELGLRCGSIINGLLLILLTHLVALLLLLFAEGVQANALLEKNSALAPMNDRYSCDSYCRGRVGGRRIVCAFKRRKTATIAILRTFVLAASAIILVILLICWLGIVVLAFGGRVGYQHKSLETQKEGDGILGNLSGMINLLARTLLALEFTYLP
mmetsp:Transcript_29666/g.86441  ORF Transcript_29666/g.86441 Transcript_29666/m.86441 type:complete len:250 (+) Transcript_29666:1070-1819(+)